MWPWMSGRPAESRARIIFWARSWGQPARSGNWAFPSRLFSFVAELQKHYWELLMDLYSPSLLPTVPAVSPVSTNPKELWREIVALHLLVCLLALHVSIYIPLSNVRLNLGWGHISMKHFTVSHHHFHTVASQMRTVRHALKEVVAFYFLSVECYEELSGFWCRKKTQKAYKGYHKEIQNLLQTKLTTCSDCGGCPISTLFPPWIKPHVVTCL